MSEFQQFPRTEGDVDSAARANRVYSAGAWLRFVVQEDASTHEQRILLGGDISEAALDYFGCDGTILAQGKKFDDNPRPYQGPPGHWEDKGEPSTVVREPERLLSNYPVCFEDDPANVVWVFDGKVANGTRPAESLPGLGYAEFGPRMARIQVILPE